MMRFADVVLVIPPLALVAAIAGNVRGGTTWLPIALILGFFTWPLYSRVIRGVVLSLREQEFIEAARAMGASDARIIFRHLLPNLTAPIIVSATIAMAIAVLAEAALSFLGVGLQLPAISIATTPGATWKPNAAQWPQITVRSVLPLVGIANHGRKPVGMCSSGPV
jgi:peptide/nickel transport system permease protein